MRQHYFRNKYVEIWIENGVVHAVHAHQVIITLEIAKMNVVHRLEITNGHTYPMFVDCRGVKSVERDARKYLTEGESIRGVSAGAFLIKSKVQTVIGNFLVNFDRQPVPCKLFSDKDKALEWLEIFKRIN